MSDHISGFQDFMPTAAELAGTSVKAACDGISFAPTLLGKNGDQKQHPYLFWNFMEQGRKQSVIEWPWKLIHLNGSRPRRIKNVAEENPAVVSRLEMRMQEAWHAP
ncbi:MAG: hypothetical protein WCK55_20335 [Verrucomicrobiota bacterium]